MEKIKNKKNYLLAFILPFLICIVIFYLKNVLTDIENIYVSDLRLQHLVFLNNLKNILSGDASVFYSFSAGMGSPMISTLIFYCISPVNLLLMFIKDVRYAILFIYIIKVSLAGLSMYILLKNKNKDNSFITVLFSTCYALSSFAINYFFCIFWFDVLYLAPLVVLGIERIIKEEKINLLYIFSLALAIICNIQMGFGLCVFSLIYYIYSYCINYDIKKDVKKLKQLSTVFIISSLCAGAISSGALLGFSLDYQGISSAREIQVTTRAATSNLLFILKNLFTVGNLKTDYYNNFEPFIYCGLITSFFSILYLFNNDIDSRKRKGAFGVILVFIISFSIEFINLFWHLSEPVLLNYRYSIYLGLFLTMLAHECYINKNKLLKKDITILSICLITGCFIMVLFSLETYIIWTFIFLLLIFTGIILAKNKNKKFEILLIILVISEIFTNGYLSIYTATNLPYGKNTSFDSLNEIGNLNEFEDDHRVMYGYTYTDSTNDTLLLNKNSSLRYFSSIINGNLLKFYNRNLSTIGNNNYRLSAYESPLLLSLLGNKYFYLKKELNNSIYEKIDSYEIESYNYETKENETQEVFLYENPYALSLGYVIESDIKYNKKMTPSDYQNEILKAFTGNNEEVIIPLEYEATSDTEVCQNTTFYSCMTYTIKNHTKNILIYAYGMFDVFTLTKNVNSYLDVNKPLLLSTINKQIELNFEYNGDLEVEKFYALTYDEEKLIDNLNMLRQNMLKNIKINKNILTGEITSSKDGILFLSIPYDKKFKIYVDNKLVDYYSLLDNAFIGLDIEEGEHKIKIKYVDENYKLYLGITLISLIISISLYYFINKKISKRIEKEQKELEQINIQKAKKKQKKQTKKRK